MFETSTLVFFKMQSFKNSQTAKYFKIETKNGLSRYSYDGI